MDESLKQTKEKVKESKERFKSRTVLSSTRAGGYHKHDYLRRQTIGNKASKLGYIYKNAVTLASLNCGYSKLKKVRPILT